MSARPGGLRRRGVAAAGKLLVSLLLLGWLARSLHGVSHRLGAVSPVHLLPALAVLAVSTLLGAWQWTLILRRVGVTVPARSLVSLYWVGMFFNNFMLGNVGGDAVKVVDLALVERGGGLSRALAATLLDRALGLIALMGVSLLAALALGGDAPAGVSWWILMAAALPVLALGLLLLSRRAGKVAAAAVRRAGLVRVAARVEETAAELRAFRLAPLRTISLLGLATLVQGTRVLTHVAVAWAMGLPLDAFRVLGLFVVVPVLGVVSTLPISLNGLGVRELTASRTMPALGISAADAVAMQLTAYFVQLALSLVGGAIFLRRLISPRRRGITAPHLDPKGAVPRPITEPGPLRGVGEQDTGS